MCLASAKKSKEASTAGPGQRRAAAVVKRSRCVRIWDFILGMVVSHGRVLSGRMTCDLHFSTVIVATV